MGEEATKRRFDVSHILLALPVLHLIVGSAYLVGYCAGFGGRINEFLKVEDLFRLSLAAVALVYANGLLVPLLVLALRYASGRPHVHSQVAAMPEVPQREAVKRKADRDQASGQAAILLSIGAWTLWALATSLNDGQPDWLRGWLPVVGWIAIGTHWLGAKFGLFDPAASIVQIVLTLIATAFMSGGYTGNLERGYDYWDASALYARCSNVALIRALGDSYLAVDLDGRKVIINEACKVQFLVPTPKPIGNRWW